MTSYYDDPFLFKTYSDELSPVAESEFDEVMRLMSEEDEGWQAYAEWADTLEPTEQADALAQYAFERQLERQAVREINGVRILIKRDCNHTDCRSSRCSRETRLRGVSV